MTKKPGRPALVRAAKRTLFAGSIVVASACGEEVVVGVPPFDAGPGDAGEDAPRSMDAAGIPAPDAGLDPDAFVGTDAALDASAAPDAFVGMDAAVAPDAGPDAEVEVGLPAPDAG